MPDVKIVYDEERITVGDLLRVEEAPEGEATRRNIELLSKLVVNGDGKYLPEDEAFEELSKFSLGELRRASEEIRAAAQGDDSPK